MHSKHTSHWLIDAVLFTGLIAAFFLDLTGLELHQWIGISGGALALYHLLAHWQWVGAVTERLLRQDLQQISPVLPDQCRPAGRVSRHHSDRPDHLFLAQLTLIQYGTLAHDPHPRLDRDSDPGDLKDRTALALDCGDDTQGLLPAARPGCQAGSGPTCTGQ